MRACFYSVVRGLIVLGLASGPLAVIAQENGATPPESSSASDTQESPDAPASSPGGTLLRPETDRSSGAASEANANRPSRPGATRTAATATAAAASDAASATKADTPIPVPPETTSVTRHSIRLDGKKIDYTATAGNLLLRNNAGQAEASVFYVAYTANTKNSGTRPITFLFNGGPGAGSVFLLMGSFGP